MPYTKKYAETLYNPAWLAREYVEKQRSAPDIANEIGVDHTAVTQRLHRYGIPVRSLSEAQRIAPHPGSSAPRPKKARNTLHNYEWLYEYYVRRGLNASEISKLVDVKVPSVITALKKFGFRVRGVSEAKQGRRVTPKTILPDPCVVCGGPACEVNHIDRNHDNDKKANRESLCTSHHMAQHRLEESILLARVKIVPQSPGTISNKDYVKYLVQSGWSPQKLHRVARKQLMRKEVQKLQLKIASAEKQLAWFESQGK